MSCEVIPAPEAVEKCGCEKLSRYVIPANAGIQTTDRQKNENDNRLRIYSRERDEWHTLYRCNIEPEEAHF